jgi:hypothetical protein
MNINWLTLIKGKLVCGPYAKCFKCQATNEVKIMGIFCKNKFHVSNDCGSSTKFKRDHERRIC